MYKIKEFAEMLNVTTCTLRNKHKNGLLVPSCVKPGTNYRLYSDELAYIYDDNRYILAYLSKTKDSEVIDCFKDKLDSLNVKYKMFVGDKSSSDYFNNNAIKELLIEASNKKTYTVLYDEKNILEQDLKLIKFYLNTCFSYIKIKKLEDFSLEKSLELVGV